MKPITIAFCCIIALLLGTIFIGATELNDLNRIKQAEIDGLKRQNEVNERAYLKSLDSIHRYQELLSDSLRVAREEKNRDQKTVTTKTESHEKIIFVNLDDSTRHRKLSDLYPSYQRP